MATPAPCVPPGPCFSQGEGESKGQSTSLLLPFNGLKLSLPYLAAWETGNEVSSQAVMGLCKVSLIMVLTQREGVTRSFCPGRTALRVGGKAGRWEVSGI